MQRTFRSVVVRGLATVILLSVVVTGAVGAYIATRTRKTVVAQAKQGLAEITKREAELRSDPFERIAFAARLLQRDQEAVLAHPELHPAPRGPITLKTAENGSAYKAEKNGGASVFVPRYAPLTPERVRFALLTEAFDPLMQGVVAALPETVVAAYFNGADGLNRYVPFIDDVWKQFDPMVDARAFNFYYVADDAHDPEGIPKWTEAYLDPAGQGWMITCAVPIRRDGKVVGVTGLDVTIGKLLESVVDLPLPSGGAAMLTGPSGQILAMSPRLEPVLGLKELGAHDYGGEAVHAETRKPEEFQVTKSPSPIVRDFFARALVRAPSPEPEELRVADRDFVVTQATVREPGWRLFVFTPRAELIAPLDANRRRALGLFAALIAILVGVGTFTMIVVLRRSRAAARS